MTRYNSCREGGGCWTVAKLTVHVTVADLLFILSGCWYGQHIQIRFSQKIYCIPIQISFNCIPKRFVDNKSALSQMITWCRVGDNTLPEPMMLPVHWRIHVSSGLNPSPPSAAYMPQFIRSALVQVITCRLFEAKPLPKPMLAYCRLDPWEDISMKFVAEFYHFHTRKCILF